MLQFPDSALLAVCGFRRLPFPAEFCSLSCKAWASILSCSSWLSPVGAEKAGRGAGTSAILAAKAAASASSSLIPCWKDWAARERLPVEAAAIGTGTLVRAGSSVLKGPVKKFVIFDCVEAPVVLPPWLVFLVLVAALACAALPANLLLVAVGPSQLWSVGCLWVRQKVSLHESQVIFTNSFFLHFGLLHLFVNTFSFFLLLAILINMSGNSEVRYSTTSYRYWCIAEWAYRHLNIFLIFGATVMFIIFEMVRTKQLAARIAFHR